MSVRSNLLSVPGVGLMSDKRARNERRQKLKLPFISNAGPCKKCEEKKAIDDAPDCVMCPELRKIAGRAADTFIEQTKPSGIRWCECRVCGHRWKLIPKGAAGEY